MILLIHFYIVEGRVGAGVNYAFLSLSPLEELEINAYQSLSIFVLFEYLYSKSANFVGEFPIIPSWGDYNLGRDSKFSRRFLICPPLFRDHRLLFPSLQCPNIFANMSKNHKNKKIPFA